MRAVEIVYALEEALRIIGRYERPEPPAVDVPPRAGIGHGVSEAPRGLLYHRYELDADGLIESAVIVPPTSQNQAAIEDDLRAVVAANLNLADDDADRAVRADDPQLRPVHLLLDALPRPSPSSAGERRDAVLIGVGNSYRRDDGVGAAVVAPSAGSARPACRCSPRRRTAGLIEAWSGADQVVLVDAVRVNAVGTSEAVPTSKTEPGRVHRRVLVPGDPAAWPSPGAASSHRMGVTDALRLAGALDRLPRRLTAFGVEVADIGYGPGLSPAVEAAIPELVEAVLAELGVS